MDTLPVPTASRPMVKPLYWRLHLIVLVIGLVAVLSSVLALHYLEIRMIGTAGEGLALAASDIANKLDWVLFERYADVQVLAKVAGLHLHNRQALTGYLNTVQQSYPMYLWIAVTNAEGTIIASTDSAHVGLDRHERPWFQAVRSGTIYIGEVAFSPDSGHVQAIPLAAPVADAQGRFVGAVIVSVGMPVLEEAAVRTARTFQGREGFYGRLEYELLKSTGEVFIDSLSQNVDSSNLKHLGLPSVQLLLSGSPGYVTEMHARRHIPVLTGYARTEGYGTFAGLNWGVLVRLDARDVLAPIRKVQEVLALVGALVFVPLMGVLFWSSHRLRREWTQAQAHRTHAEEAEQKIRNILEHSTQLFYSHTSNHVLTYLSPQARAYIGCDLGATPTNWMEFLTDNPVNRKGIELTQRAIDTGQAQPPYELELKTKDGRIMWVEVHEAPVVRDGKTVTIVGSLTDITERRRAQDALRRNEEWFRSLLENATDLIAAFDADGTIRYASPSHRILGYAPADLVGKTVVSLIHPDDLPTVSEVMTQALQAPGTRRSVEARVRTADGQWLILDATGQAASDASGRTQVVVNSRDITERKRMEMSARRMEHMAMLGLLVGGITHEIKNPLFVLTGSIHILKEQLAAKDYAGLEADLDRMENAGESLDQTIQRFLALARPAPPSRERCLVQSILQQTLDLLHHEFLRNQINVVTAISPDLPSIESDPRLIQGAFLNPIMNAVQAMHSAHGKGTLTVSARLIPPLVSPPSEGAGKGRGGWIEVRIQDDGPGILAEHQAKLFEPFFTTKPPGVGTGLGLWTVRTNLASLGGTVTCETEVGRGATFIVRLPLASPSALQKNPDGSREPQHEWNM